jgi:hypothetical protein
MDPLAAQHLVHAYVQAWRAGDRAFLGAMVGEPGHELRAQVTPK